jgi:hypothetical protein
VQNWQTPKPRNGEVSGAKAILKRIVPDGLRDKIRFYRQYYLWKWDSTSFRPLKYGRRQTEEAAMSEKSGN